MTPVTCRSSVIALEQIGGVTVVIEEQRLPVPFGVAALALFAESPLVGIALLMAGVTVGRRLIFIEVPLMAGGAGGRDMLSPQWIPSVQLVIEGDCFPVVRPVASLTLFTVGPFMFVVLFVTGITIHWGILEGRRQMALFAFYLGVFAHQWETSLVVVERRFLPRPVSVAVLALCALLPFMLVIFFMAGIAVHRGVFITIVRVTTLARHLDMLVPNLVASGVMIEPNVLPVSFGVAVCAGGSHLPFVLIVFLVATIAIGWSIAVLSLGFMARLAFDLLCVGMGAFEREVRSLMVEGLLRDRRDVLHSAFVLSVAFLAVPLLLEATVRSLLLIDIFADIFVAIEA